jgi:hypothetical protein
MTRQNLGLANRAVRQKSIRRLGICSILTRHRQGAANRTTHLAQQCGKPGTQALVPKRAKINLLSSPSVSALSQSTHVAPTKPLKMLKYETQPSHVLQDICAQRNLPRDDLWAIESFSTRLLLVLYLHHCNRHRMDESMSPEPRSRRGD